MDRNYCQKSWKSHITTIPKPPRKIKTESPFLYFKIKINKKLKKRMDNNSQVTDLVHFITY